MTNLRLALACVVIVGCTFGGGHDDPTNGLSVTDIDGGESSTADGSLDASASTIDAKTAPASDASAVSHDGGGSSNGDGGGAGACTPAKALTTCDPVKNTGCTLVWQCDLDTTAVAQAGRCVVYNPIALSGCSSDAYSTTCTGGNACVSGACQKVCYCDGDCSGGKTCSGSIGGATGPVKYCK